MYLKISKKIAIITFSTILLASPTFAYKEFGHVQAAMKHADELAAEKLAAKKQAIYDNVEKVFSADMISTDANNMTINAAQTEIFTALAKLDADAEGIVARIDDLEKNLEIIPGDSFELISDGIITAGLISNGKSGDDLSDTVTMIRDYVLPLFQSKFPEPNKGQIVASFAMTERSADDIKAVAEAFSSKLPDGIFGRKAPKIRSQAALYFITSFVESTRDVSEIEMIATSFADQDHKAFKNALCDKKIVEFISSDKPIAEFTTFFGEL